MMSNFQYRTGPAGLFAAMSRQDPPEDERVAITCSWCLSEDTEMIDHEHDIYRCLNCGETFVRRPAPESQDGD